MKNVVILKGTSETFQVFWRVLSPFYIYFQIKMHAFLSLGTVLHYSYHQHDHYCLLGRQLTTVVFPVGWKGRNKAR